MSRGAGAVAGMAALLGACVYYNALYNAERLFAEGERYRREGRDSLAAARYQEVVLKAAKGYRQEPEGEWADDALLLMGRAYLRSGDLRTARATLERAAAVARTEEVRLGALLYLGIGEAQAGDDAAAAPLLDQALGGLPPGPMAAEGHLCRGRIRLRAGDPDAGWRDLDRAADADRSVRMEVALERLGWGIGLDDPVRAREGMDRLLAYGEAGARVDTVAALARRAASRWEPAAAADLLAGVDSAAWGPSPRGMLRLTRAGLLREAGDTAEARRQVRRVATGFGAAAAEARLELARWQLARARDLLDARDAVPILLPAASSPRVASLLEGLDDVARLAELGLDEPLAWFAAGEAARDRLGAPELARGLFLAYADAQPADPWTAKALLAALAVTDDEGGRAWLRGRLEGRGDSPYVLAARGAPAPGLEDLEEELARRLQEIAAR